MAILYFSDDIQYTRLVAYGEILKFWKVGVVVVGRIVSLMELTLREVHGHGEKSELELGYISAGRISLVSTYPFHIHMLLIYYCTTYVRVKVDLRFLPFYWKWKRMHFDLSHYGNLPIFSFLFVFSNNEVGVLSPTPPAFRFLVSLSVAI